MQLNLSNISKIDENGLSIFDIYGEVITEEYFAAGISKLSVAYERDYIKDKPQVIAILFEQLKRLKWSKEKFDEAIENMICSNKFINWVIADFININLNEPKLYSRQWMLNQCHKNGYTEKDFDSYDLPVSNSLLYKLHDGVELDPEKFPRWGTARNSTSISNSSQQAFDIPVKKLTESEIQKEYKEMSLKYFELLKKVTGYESKIKDLEQRLNQEKDKNRKLNLVLDGFLKPKKQAKI